MKRICHAVAALGLAMLLAGCCYKPCTYDPVTGVMYGGGLEPCCCGPLDPFCMFCNGCEQPLYPSLWRGGCGGCGGCGLFSGGGCGLFSGGCCAPATNCCQDGWRGGGHCGPHTMLPSPAYGGVVPPGAHFDGGVVYGAPVFDGGTIIHQDGMLESIPGGSQPAANGPSTKGTPSSPPPAPPSEPADPADPAEDQVGPVVPWPLAPPSAKQPTRPASFKSHGGRWIPARR